MIDYTGSLFGEWVVLGDGPPAICGRRRVRVQCSCGKIAYNQVSNLRSGGSKSCGHNMGVTHGQTRGEKCTSAYAVWKDLLRRCYNPNATNYERYGGRGITVCDSWRESFENFYRDMGDAPKGLQLDRMDNSAGYSPENCRWITRLENMRNTRANINLTWNGKTQCLSAWVEELGIARCILRYRIKRKWSVEKAFTTPVKVRGLR